jgi:hypothetical protein
MCNVAIIARAGSALLAGFGLTILSASLAWPVYGPRTTIGANYQQWSAQQSPNGIDPGQCTGSGCNVLFQAIPQQKQLIVRHVACRANVNTGALISVQVRTRGVGVFPDRYTPLVPVNLSTGWWAVNSPVMHLLKSGERPIVSFSNTASAVWIAECSISGTFHQS